MSNHESVPLTSSELGYLWTGYAINEMSKWFLTVFQAQAKDEDVKAVYSYALEISSEILSSRGDLLNNDGYPLPKGFSQKDINLDSLPLFSDRFLLHYLHIGARVGLVFHSRSLALATRLDVRKYHNDCLQTAIQLNDKIVDIMLKKGIYWRSPHLPAPEQPEKIQKTSYLQGWFGDIRALNSIEIANLYLIIDMLTMIETLCMGFAQTAKSEEISDLFNKGLHVIEDHYNDLVELLKKDDLPIPPSFKTELTASKERIFSDRIMLCHMAGLFGSLLSQYGFSIGSVMKHDLVKTYSALIIKGGFFTEIMARTLINNEWLEKVPGVISREDRFGI